MQDLIRMWHQTKIIPYDSTFMKVCYDLLLSHTWLSINCIIINIIECKSFGRE